MCLELVDGGDLVASRFTYHKRIQYYHQLIHLEVPHLQHWILHFDFHLILFQLQLLFHVHLSLLLLLGHLLLLDFFLVLFDFTLHLFNFLFVFFSLLIYLLLCFYHFLQPNALPWINFIKQIVFFLVLRHKKRILLWLHHICNIRILHIVQLRSGLLSDPLILLLFRLSFLLFFLYLLLLLALLAFLSYLAMSLFLGQQGIHISCFSTW